MYILIPAIILDLILGDPNFYPHPIVIIGKLISYLEKHLRDDSDKKELQRFKGIVLVILTLVIVFISIYILSRIIFTFNQYLGIIFHILILYSMIAIKGLYKAGIEIYRDLKNDKLNKARKHLDMIVGRDTETLNRQEIIRAVVETVAENTSDGIIAPIFYFLVGGPILAVIYKTINTMDSMLGYKNKKYKYFGWAAARLDDIANFIPARITAIFIIIAAFIYRKDYKRAYNTVIKDAKKHDSPNAGFPEAAVAGALKIQLGGINKYFGEPSKKPLLGEKLKEFENDDIYSTLILMFLSTFSFVIISFLLIYII